MTSPAVGRVLARLDGPRRSGDGWSARCPAHDDRKPSLMVSEGADGRAIVKCHADCSTEDVVAALELTMADLFGESAAANGRRSIAATYDYNDEQGGLLYQVVRRTPKDFRQRRPDPSADGGWTWSLNGVRRVPYRLPELIRAVAEDHTIFVTEGEKDADALVRAGMVATCNPGGAGKWRGEYARYFTGADVVVVADRDEPGRRHAEQVAASLQPVAAHMRVVEPKAGKDAADHLAAGRTVEEFEIVWGTGPGEPVRPVEPGDRDARSGGQTPPAPDADASPADQLRAAMLHGAAIEEVPPPEPLVAGWLDLDSLAVLYGRPKSGKSFLALDLALCVATGSWWHGHAVTEGPVVYVVAEGKRGMGQRVKAWRTLNRSYQPVEGVHWLPRAVNLLQLGWPAALAEVCAQLRPVLVVIDTLARSMAGGDENASKDMGLVIAAVDLLRRHTGACVLLVHHSGKDATAGARGHSSLLGALDTELEVRNGGDGLILLTNTEQKDHAAAEPLRFTLASADESVAIAPHTGRTPPDERLTRGAVTTLGSLHAIALPEGIATTVWRDRAIADGVSKAAFYGHLKTLADLELTENVGTDKAPRYRPTEHPTP